MPEFEELNRASPVMPGDIDLHAIPSASVHDFLAIYEETNEVAQTQRANRSFEAGNVLARYFIGNRNPRPIASILSAVSNRWDACGIRETPYLDLEFWSNHVGFYDWCFRRYPVHSERFHFFGLSDTLQANEKVTLQKLIDMLRAGLTWNEIIDSFIPSNEHRAVQPVTDPPPIVYLGNCVIRPTRSFVVGRTTPAFDERITSELPKVAQDHLLDVEVEGIPCLTMKYECTATILSTALKLTTAEFTQQDPNLGPCATASVWVATRCLSQRFNLNKYDYATITRQAMGASSRDRGATATFDPNSASNGLYTSEIETAFLETGAHPLTFGRAGTDKPSEQASQLRQELYSFVESGIPVLVFTNGDPEGYEDGHVMVAVGHSLPSHERIRAYIKPAKKCIPSDLSHISDRHYLVSTMIPVYYAHDDRYGPFNRLRFLTDHEQFRHNAVKHGQNALRRRKSYPPPSVLVGGRHSPQRQYISQLMVPLPPGIRVGSYAPLVEVLGRFDEKYLKVFQDNENFLWRSFLVEGARFKQSTVEREYAPQLRAWYAGILLPKYVWVFEVTVLAKDDFSQMFAESTPRYIHGEFLYDPTSPVHELRPLTRRLLGRAADYRGGNPMDVPPAESDWCVYECFQRG